MVGLTFSRGLVIWGPLTYMSIRDEIRHRHGEGRLFHLLPLMPGVRAVRHMFVSPEIYNVVVKAPSNDTDEGKRFGRLRGDLDRFTEGAIISIANSPYKKNKKAYLARLDPPTDEVWYIRSVDPKPAIRVFGQFAMTDVFVALTWAWRIDLKGPESKEWRNEIQRCKAEWRKLFPSYNPHKGANLNDYVSDNFFAV